MTDDKVLGANDIRANAGEEADEVAEGEIQPIDKLDKQITEKVQASVGDVEAMISAKVRSLSKPRSG